jgi:hypothetical protein
MAVATAAIATITKVQTIAGISTIYGTITVGASPLTYTTGGIALTIAGFDQIKSSGPAIWFEAQSSPAAGTSPSGYTYVPTVGAAGACKLAIFTGAAAQSPLAELSNAASIPAAVSGDTIAFTLVMPSDL